MSDTPNIDRLNEHAAERDTILDFLQWLHTNRMNVGEYRLFEGHLAPSFTETGQSDDALALAYLTINEQALEQERRMLLANLGG